MSKQYLTWFLREHQMEELSDVLHNARRFYETTFGILKTVPSQMLFQHSMLECPPEKIIGLLHLIGVQSHEKNLFWIGKLYFVLPLPPDWIEQPTSFDTKKFFFQSLKSDFHPSIAYVLFLVHTFRTVDTQVSNLPLRAANDHKNSCHFIRSDFRTNSETVNAFALNPFKILEQNFSNGSKVVAVSLAKEYQVFAKRFEFLLKSPQKLLTFVLSMPQRNLRSYLTSLKRTKEALSAQNTHTSNAIKMQKDYNIKIKKNTFMDIIENKENQLTNSVVTSKRYYHPQPGRPKSQQSSIKIEADNTLAQKLKAWNEPQPPRSTWANKLSMPNKVDRVLGQNREDTESDMFTTHDRIYRLRNTPLKSYIRAASVSMNQREISQLKNQLQVQKVFIPMSKLWSSLGRVQTGGSLNTTRASMNQTGSKLIQLRR
jgi:hypothetical protein